ncbi:VWA domain-containing protein [Streptomyces sp. NPDC002992]|uniref:VWA domain-containing protein n=1 Tax=Streptomyces sp. NPDC002992 TaxID=3154273 RepID=UPI0033B37624
MTLPSPTPAESATERATTDTAAKRAADDLVAAAFDNLKVPNARPAEPEKPAEPKTEAAAAAETPEPAEPETEVAAAAEATEVTAASGSTAEPEATELSETAVEQPDALEPTAEKVTEGDEPATPEATVDVSATPAELVEAEATVDTDARAPEGEADAPAAEEAERADADASDDATAVEPAAADTAEPQADAPAADEATTPAEQAEAETVDADVTAPEGEADAPAAEEAERADADASDDATAAKPAAADTAEPETDTATDADAPEPVAVAVDAGSTPASEAEDAPATEPHGAPATTATPLSQVKADAPYLVEAYKAAGAVLKKQGLIGARAAVYLVVDRSGSMRGYFKDGSVQRLAEQTVALAAHLDEDATVTAVFFSTDIDGTAELRPAGLEGRIDEINAGLGRLGRTNYHRAVEEVLAHHEKTDPTRPAFVVFQTDGAPESKTAATQALAEAADRPIHWQFVAWGEEDNKAFDYLRKLTAPRTGHFLAGATPSETAHAAFYRGLLADWQL